MENGQYFRFAELQQRVFNCKNTGAELKRVAKQELLHSNCNMSQCKDLLPQANEKSEVVCDLWHRLMPGHGQRASNSGAVGIKWSLCVSPY